MGIVIVREWVYRKMAGKRYGYVMDALKMFHISFHSIAHLVKAINIL